MHLHFCSSSINLALPSIFSFRCKVVIFSLWWIQTYLFNLMVDRIVFHVVWRENRALVCFVGFLLYYLLQSNGQNEDCLIASKLSNPPRTAWQHQTLSVLFDKVLCKWELLYHETLCVLDCSFVRSQLPLV